MIAVDLKYNMPMDSTDQVQTRGSSQLNLALVELKDVFCDYFEGLVDDCCYRLEIDFGIHLGQKRAHIEKQAYIDLLQSLKQQKSGMFGFFLPVYLQVASIFFCKLPTVFCDEKHNWYFYQSCSQLRKFHHHVQKLHQ